VCGPRRRPHQGQTCHPGPPTLTCGSVLALIPGRIPGAPVRTTTPSRRTRGSLHKRPGAAPTPPGHPMPPLVPARPPAAVRGSASMALGSSFATCCSISSTRNGDGGGRRRNPSRNVAGRREQNHVELAKDSLAWWRSLVDVDPLTLPRCWVARRIRCLASRPSAPAAERSHVESPGRVISRGGANGVEVVADRGPGVRWWADGVSGVRRPGAWVCAGPSWDGVP
jgi:hypothetical protein